MKKISMTELFSGYLLLEGKKLFIVTAPLALSALSYAQTSGGDAPLVKSTKGNGGSTTFGGEFSPTGTAGQPGVSPRIARGGSY